MNIAVFVSGRGSNLQAILESKKLTGLVSVKFVVSEKLNCPAFNTAKSYSIETITVGDKPGFTNYVALSDLLLSNNVKLIVLAGFLKLIPQSFIQLFNNKIINIHPALLPSFGGDGMYGINVHNAVFKSSAQVSGATVHFVDEEYDNGKIIAQRCVDITNCISPEEVAAKVLEVEHKLLPDVIKLIAENKITIKNERVTIIN